MNTFEAMCKAARDADVDAGHAPPDVQWGRYEVLVRAALDELLKQYARNVSTHALLCSILEGKS